MAFFSDLKQLISDPMAFFDELRSRKAQASWLPILVEILASAVLFVAYYQYVNLPWLHEQLLAGVPAEQRAKAVRFLTVNFLTVSAVISVVVTVPLITAIIGLYFYLVGKVRNLSYRFGQWFHMVAWASFVSVLALPIGLVSILSGNDGRLRPEDINPLTLGHVLFRPDTTSHWRTFAEAITALLIVEVVLLGVGYARWAGTSIWNGVLVALLPFAAIYGVWAVVLMTLGSS